MIQGTLKKIKNTGTNDPFNARMMFGIMKLRDYIVKSEQERLTFDKFYQPVLENMDEAQDHLKACITLIENHSSEVESGHIIAFQKEIIEVKETIDRKLNKNFKDFFIKGGMATKSLIPLSKHLGFPILFFFQNDRKYQKGKEEFLNLNKDKKFKSFIEMLHRDRNGWYKNFIKARDRIEHEGASLPDIKYVKTADGKVKVIFPTVDNNKITIFLNIIWNNLFEFLEDVVVSLISFKLQQPMTIRYISKDQRDKSLPLKYDIWADGLTEFLQNEAKKK